MNFDPNTDYRAFIETFAIKHLPQCKTLVANAKTIIQEGGVLFTSNRKPKEAAKEALEKIDLYGDHLDHALEFTGLQSLPDRARIDIQSGAAVYVVALVAKSYGVSLKGISKHLDKIEKTSKHLKYLLEPNSELIAIGGSVSLTEFVDLTKSSLSEAVEADDGDEFLKDLFVTRYQRLSKELEYFSDLRREFSNSIPAKWIQFGASGPKESSALNVWITNLAEVWHFQFGRSLTLSPNPNEGREKFLTFAEICFEAVHPSLTNLRPDAIRNAYEKLRKKGEFDYLDQNSSRLV